MQGCSDTGWKGHTISEHAKPRIAPVPGHLHTVTPRLVVSDGSAAIDFYRAAFGATELSDRFMTPDGAVIHAELSIGDSVVMITEENAEGDRWDRAVSAIMATYWQDVDAAWERAIAAGAEVIHPLANHFYGERGGRLRDPFGQQWMLSARIETLTAEELAQRAARYFQAPEA